MLTTSPLALVLEDDPGQALITRRTLEAGGFQVEIAATLGVFVALAERHLAPTRGYPVLLLADCMGIAPHRPDLEGTTALAFLAEAMRRGTLRPALLVAFSSDPNEDRIGEAASAGCAFLLPKPLLLAQAVQLQQHVCMQPPTIPVAPVGPDRAFQTLAYRTVAAVTAAPPRWTATEAYALLANLTNFRLQIRAQPAPPLSVPVDHLIDQLGGISATLTLLNVAVQELAYPFNLVLDEALQAANGRGVVSTPRLTMGRSSRSAYRKELPAQLARWLNARRALRTAQESHDRPPAPDRADG